MIAPRRDLWLRELGRRKLGFTWCVLFLVGAWVIRSAPVGESRRLLVPATILIGYFLYGMAVERKSVATFADSIYFMGFLWTLIALIDVLVPGKVTAGLVFKAFGYALVTTALGMFLRVLLLQFHETLPDRLVDAQQEIDREVLTFTEHVEGTGQEIHRFRERMREGLEAELAQLTDTLATTRAKIEETHAAAAEISVDRLRAVVDAVISRLNQFEVPTEKIKDETAKLQRALAQFGTRVESATAKVGERLERSAELLAASSETLARRIESVEVPGDLLVEYGRQLSERLQEAVAATLKSFEIGGSQIEESLRSVARELVEIPNKVGLEAAGQEMANTVRRVIDREDRFVEACHGFTNKLEGAGGELEAMTEIFRRTQSSLADLERQAGRLSSASLVSIADQLVAAERAVAEARSTGTQLQDTVTEVLAFIRQRLQAADLP